MAGRGGVDMEALSPRDVNALPKRTTDLKAKAAAQLRTAKDKDHPPPPPPQVVEPPSSDRKNGAVYQVGKLLGKGGFAICYDGKHVDSGKKYALKIVKSTMPVKMQQKFHRAFTFESCTYLILELCPNGSLMEMVKKRKGLTEAEVRFYTIQIAGAIKYMHGKGIIHRDLKMGNIFLDRNMNAKVGDFGLAALLVTGNDMHTIRRTTLCGTPNYIAPEILQKGKAGHDHNVDIWSLGIIMFAMLTTKPPFQSSTTDEIYRRARDRDYDWPQNDQKLISLEVKDIVASMLVEADRRPDPDAIVQHPFFTAGYVPAQADITSRLRETAPEQEIFHDSCASPRLQERVQSNLRELCQQCDVGPWQQNIQPVKAAIWREIASEEKHGLTPGIPLAVDIVYRPYDELRREKHQLQASQSVSLLCEKTEALTLDAPAKWAPSGWLKAPPQSFAAQQRAANKPMNAIPSSRTQPSMNAAPARPLATRSRGIKKDIPLTTSGALSVEDHEQAKKVSTRATRTQLPSSKTQPTARPALATRSSSTTKVDPPMPPKEDSTGEKKVVSLFGPGEPQEYLEDTRPDLVLSRMRKLQAELERALNSRSMAYISTKQKGPEIPKVVVKWVDYTNKFGLGYILNDGSAGCILNSVTAPGGDAQAVLPPSFLLVHDAEKHISRRNDQTYHERHQVVPMTEPIYFYETKGEEGISRVRVDPDEFRVPVSQTGTASKLGPGKNEFEHRKRERIVLWKKFANYMLQHAREHPDAETPRPYPVDVPGDLFNFPDHTKIVLDRTGTWCHFWHLSQEAAEQLASTGGMDEASLDDRAVLSYPLQTLLNFSTVPKASQRSVPNSTRHRPEIPLEIQGIPAANDFRRKVEFIRAVVKEWARNGGIGKSDMSRDGRLKWPGLRQTRDCEVLSKQAWVTVGARGEDSRHAVWVDSRNPTTLLDEIDETKKS
ncbi:Cell cycle serine/threonine-protein kinase cdc5/MSD2 [Diaporthe eres]